MTKNKIDARAHVAMLVEALRPKTPPYSLLPVVGTVHPASGAADVKIELYQADGDVTVIRLAVNGHHKTSWLPADLECLRDMINTILPRQILSAMEDRQRNGYVAEHDLGPCPMCGTPNPLWCGDAVVECPNTECGCIITTKDWDRLQRKRNVKRTVTRPTRPEITIDEDD